MLCGDLRTLAKLARPPRRQIGLLLL